LRHYGHEFRPEQPAAALERRHHRKKRTFSDLERAAYGLDHLPGGESGNR
jgi:hypothetical protein